MPVKIALLLLSNWQVDVPTTKVYLSKVANKR